MREIRVTAPKGKYDDRIELALIGIDELREAFVHPGHDVVGGTNAWCISLFEGSLKNPVQKRRTLKKVLAYLKGLPISYRIGLVEVPYEDWLRELYPEPEGK